MKLPFLTSVILFVVVLGHRIRLQRRISEKNDRSFWEREAAANATRRKSLDGLDYISIPLEKLPCEILTEDEQVADCINLLRTLSTQKIVNFTGFSNTDLKLEYGAPNITLLSEYDQNYTLMVRTLQKWADLLWDKDHQSEAVEIMEFALSTETDVSRTYYLLAQYYKQKGNAEKLSHLSEVARALRSSHKRQILNHLEELS